MMSLDQVYKSRVAQSHEAGLQAVFDAGVEQGRAHALTPAPEAPTGPVVVGDVGFIYDDFGAAQPLP